MLRQKVLNASDELGFGLALAAKEGKRDQSLVGAEATSQYRPRLVINELLDGSARAVHKVWTLEGDNFFAQMPTVDATEDPPSIMTRRQPRQVIRDFRC